eukprot:PhM_4_TR15256/c2_g2_i8/m.8462
MTDTLPSIEPPSRSYRFAYSEEDEEKVHRIKVVFVGSVHVGKTEVVKMCSTSLQTTTFDSFVNERCAGTFPKYEPTIGVEIFARSILATWPLAKEGMPRAHGCRAHILFYTCQLWRRGYGRCYRHTLAFFIFSFFIKNINNQKKKK